MCIRDRLLPLFLGENEPDALNCRAKALALAVRQYDTTGRGVFVCFKLLL